MLHPDGVLSREMKLRRAHVFFWHGAFLVRVCIADVKYYEQKQSGEVRFYLVLKLIDHSSKLGVELKSKKKDKKPEGLS